MTRFNPLLAADLGPVPTLEWLDIDDLYVDKEFRMNRELIEKIAGAICNARTVVNGHPNEDVCPLKCPWCEASAESAVKAIKDADYAIVPVSPNHKMIRAVANLPASFDWDQFIADSYKAMIKAAEGQ